MKRTVIRDNWITYTGDRGQFGGGGGLHCGTGASFILHHNTFVDNVAGVGRDTAKGQARGCALNVFATVHMPRPKRSLPPPRD